MRKVLFALFLFILCITSVNAGTLKSIMIDGKTCSNTSSIEECLSGETYSYDSENKVLTLNNYNCNYFNIILVYSRICIC